MTQAEVGAYSLLLGWSWMSHGQGLPNDPAVLRKLARGPVSPRVLACFEDDGNGRLFNPKSQEQWEEVEQFTEKQARNGRLGGRPKKNPSLSSGLSQTEPNQKPPVREEVEEKDSSESSSLPDFGRGGERGGGRPARAEDVPIPPEIDTPAFRDAWLGRWLPWRRSSDGKGRPVSVLAARAQLAKLAPCGPEQACAAIAQSIANDWQGLFPERVDAGVKPRFAGSNVDPATLALLDEESRS